MILIVIMDIINLRIVYIIFLNLETYTDLATIPKPDSTYSEIDVAEMPAYENAIAERRQGETLIHCYESICSSQSLI